jgi:hypothetical protein
MKVPKEQFQKSVTDKRPDQIFRKTKIISTLGKYTSNLVSKKKDSLIVLRKLYAS